MIAPAFRLQFPIVTGRDPYVRFNISIPRRKEGRTCLLSMHRDQFVGRIKIDRDTYWKRILSSQPACEADQRLLYFLGATLVPYAETGSRHDLHLTPFS